MQNDLLVEKVKLKAILKHWNHASILAMEGKLENNLYYNLTYFFLLLLKRYWKT